MYELYSRETDPRKRKVIKTYETAEEAGKDLGLGERRVRQAAAYCRRYWNSGSTATYACLILENSGAKMPVADTHLEAKPKKPKQERLVVNQDEGYSPKFKQWFTVEWTKATQRLLKGAGKCKTEKLKI